MSIFTLKLTPELAALLEAAARQRQVTRSEMMRECIEEYLTGPPGNAVVVSCLDLARGLYGSQPGPPDASTNPAYLDGLGLPARKPGRKRRKISEPRR